MAENIHPKPHIDPEDFKRLFDMKRYFVVDLTSIIAKARITKPMLLDAVSKVDSSITGARIKALLRNEPVILDHAQAFVTALNALLSEKGFAPRERLEPADSIEGAFFLLEDFDSILKSRKISIDDLAAASHYPNKLVTAATLNYRLTLTTSLDLIRLVNVLRADGTDPVNPLEIITTNYQKVRKAAANGSRASRDGYTKWPPDTLLDADKIVAERSVVVTPIRRR